MNTLRAEEGRCGRGVMRNEDVRFGARDASPVARAVWYRTRSSGAERCPRPIARGNNTSLGNATSVSLQRRLLPPKPPADPL